MALRPLTAEDAGKRVCVVLPFPREEGLTGYREYYGTLVWDENDPEAPIGLQTINGSALKAGTEGEVLE